MKVFVMFEGYKDGDYVDGYILNVITEKERKRRKDELKDVKLIEFDLDLEK